MNLIANLIKIIIVCSVSTSLSFLPNVDSARTKRENNIISLSIKDTLKNQIDSLKWIMYSMNYYKTASHYRYDSFPKLSILECDVKLNGVNNDHKDTILFHFSFYYKDIKDLFLTESFYYDGLGYSNVSKSYFPLISNVYPAFSVNLDRCRSFFEEGEKNFIKFLKTYTGNLCSWLRIEAVKRKILMQ